MKSLLIFSACCVFVLVSCTNKPVVKPSSGVSATIDGVDENFNTIDSADYRHTSTFYSMSVSASNGPSATADKLQLSVFSPTPVDTGTYILSPGNYHPPFVPLIVYKINGSNNFADDYVIDYTGAHQIKITITSLSTSHVQGTFSGTLVVAAGTSGATKTITNGKFNVDIK